VSLKSTFKSDLEKEQHLSILLDGYYKKHLKAYDFERISDFKEQITGVDLIFTNKTSGKRFYIDEKAQLDYINEELPTFAFELQYHKNSKSKKGWLFDAGKKTHFYSLITAIYSDEPKKFTSCKITFVNRERLVAFLESRNIDEKELEICIAEHSKKQGKLTIDQLNDRKEGYLYFSSNNKVEKPVNLILKLHFLEQNGVAKRLI